MLGSEYKPYSAFSKALERKTNHTETRNGAVALKSTLSACVDYFFATLKNEEEYYNIFKKALNENPEKTIKILFWHRDCRGTGQGRRKNFKFVLSKLDEWRDMCSSTPFSCNSIFHYGRTDDMLVLMDTKAGKDTLLWIKTQLKSNNGLVAKWLPRESGKDKFFAKRIAKFLSLSSKEYRKLLVANTNVVETKMCSKKWEEINYSHVPSQCFLRSRNAFKKNDAERFENFIEDVKEGKSEVKVTTILPNEIIGKYIANITWELSTLDHDDSLEVLWSALPKVKTNSLVVCDTSGSMSGKPYEVSVALGLYFAERNPFGGFITFAENPSWHIVDKEATLKSKLDEIKCINAGNTNMQRTFDLILNCSLDNELEPPESLIIVSDMEFDRATGLTNQKVTFFNKMRSKWEHKGIKFPKVIFWNVSASSSTPVTFDETGCALVSGYNPTIAKAIESEQEMTPESIMLRAISDINPTI